MIKELNGYKDKERIGDIMTNFDHSIEKDAETRLKNENIYGDYPAWNFHGKVWFEQDEFHCEVWQYGNIKEIISANTLEELMNQVSNQYGQE